MPGQKAAAGKRAVRVRIEGSDVHLVVSAGDPEQASALLREIVGMLVHGRLVLDLREPAPTLVN